MMHGSKLRILVIEHWRQLFKMVFGDELEDGTLFCTITIVSLIYAAWVLISANRTYESLLSASTVNLNMIHTTLVNAATFYIKLRYFSNDS
jgi:hypothetical protein